MLSLNIPQKVNIDWGTNFFKVEGPHGILIKKRGDFNIALKGSIIYIWAKKTFTLQDQINIEQNSLSIIKRLITGVWEGYTQKLKLVGVGFRATVNKDVLALKIGYSHEVKYQIPNGVKISISKRGVLLRIIGLENNIVQEVAHQIQNLHFPDSYKGRGIQFNKQNIVLKKGKKEAKK